jgi:peptidoglycan/LPS O-acetylase OafA/YrhL
MYEAYRTRRHFGSLDGIRAIAILGVLWHHTVPPWPTLPLTARGFLGVDLFFVLSGFLIVTLLLRERERNGEISLRGFYMRRTLRIFPLYYGLLALLALLLLVIVPGSGISADFRANLPFYLTYTSNWIHDVSFLAIAWSLATEEQFYLLWPPLEKYLRRFVLPLLALFLVINQAINYGLLFPAAHARLEILQSTFTPILLGVLLAHILHHPQGYATIRRWIGQPFTPLLIALVLLGVVNLPPFGSDISGTPRLAIHLLMTLFVAASVVREDHLLRPLLAWSPLVRLGAISYGMYLLHMLVRHVAAAVLARLPFDLPFGIFLLTFVGTVIAAELSFRFWETPFLRMKERWSSHKPLAPG